MRICQEGLDIIGHPVSQFHKRFVALTTSEPQLVEMKFEGRSLSPGDPRLEALDSEFFAAARDDSFEHAAEKWLKPLPELRVMPSSEIGAALAAYAGANPKLWERKAERDVARAQAFEADPLRQALVYLCEQARPPRRFMGVGAGQFVESPDGWMLTWFRVQTDQGPVWASFHPNVSVLVSGPLNDGTVVSRVSTTELFLHVQRKTGQDLSKEALFQKTGAPASRSH